MLLLKSEVDEEKGGRLIQKYSSVHVAVEQE